MKSHLKEKGLFRVGVYFNETGITTLIKDAEKAGFRRVGLPAKIQKPHGMADEWLANTDGLAKFLKNCWEYWRKAEPERLEALAKTQKEFAEIQKKMEILEKGRV